MTNKESILCTNVRKAKTVYAVLFFISACCVPVGVVEAAETVGTQGNSVAVQAFVADGTFLPLIHIGQRTLGISSSLFYMFLLLAVGFSLGMLYSIVRRKKSVLHVEFSESEITKMFNLILADVDGLIHAATPTTTPEGEYARDRLKQTIQKMESYLIKGSRK